MRIIKKLFPKVHYCRSWEGQVLTIVRWYYWMGRSFGMTKIPFTISRREMQELANQIALKGTTGPDQIIHGAGC